MKGEAVEIDRFILACIIATITTQAKSRNPPFGPKFHRGVVHPKEHSGNRDLVRLEHIGQHADLKTQITFHQQKWLQDLLPSQQERVNIIWLCGNLD